MSDSFDFKKIEEEVLDFWEKNKVFEQSLALRQAQGKKAKPFIFFEGPPTANARPAIHHFIGRVFKDVFCRYKTMRGFYVERKSGWDTHGLPVEIEVEKSLGLKSKKEIEEYGIAKFNKQAKESVWKYKEEWERFTKRIGFWLDLKNPYITYDAKYIETLWWILKKVWDKKMLFKGHKVVPFCTRCGTPLSSHEVAQGYKNVVDMSVVVKFKLTSASASFLRGTLRPRTAKEALAPVEQIYILSWTTTPWTLPGNVALAVGEKIDYVLVEKNNENYIIAKDRLSAIFEDYELKKEFKGKDLIGLEYEPLFEIPKLKSAKSYRVYPADFVTTQDGTGVVHTAVMYGEDDYNLGKKIGLPTYHTVDEQGRFTGVSGELDGRYVKDKETEGLIFKELESKNLIFKTENFEHDYPFCWRCGTPLLYYATDSWFIAMSKLEKKLSGNNKKVNWHPEHLKEGRFGEWLRGVKDWAISRERYWGTPLPIWECKKCEHKEVVGSFDDLEKHRWHKKNNYYLMRHGISTKNEDGIISSKLENDHYSLSEKGKKDVEEEAKKLKKAGIDLIFSSPFLRAKETAEIISKATGAEIHLDERLKEIDHGTVCEGRREVVCLPEGLNRAPNLDFPFGDGESWNDTRKRMMNLILEVDKKYEGKNILIVGHGDPLAMLTGNLQGWSDAKLLEMVRGDSKSRVLDKEGQKMFYPKKGKSYKAELKNWSWDEKGYLNPHRPYIDEVFLRCAKCGEKMERVKAVADVWFDSGAMPYAQWHYPFENKDKIDRNPLRKAFGVPTQGSAFPADFIAEAIDQTRGWFYTLLAVSTLLDEGPAYKNVLSYGHVLDEKGQKMSKSKGNVIDPWMVMEKFGVDAVRWYFYSVNNPGEPKLFSLDEVALRFRGFVMTLWNSFRFFELYRPAAEIEQAFGKQGQVPKGTELNAQFNFGTGTVNFHKTKPTNLLDQWVLSRLSQMTEVATKAMDDYDPTTATRAIEKFVIEDFSKWWLRRSRAKFQRPVSEKSLKESLALLRFILLEISKLIAPFTPFIAEKIHHDLHKGTSAGTESVHWHDWPSQSRSWYGSLTSRALSEFQKLTKDMEEVRKLVTLGLAQRKNKNLKVRQPLASAILKLKDKLDPELEELIKDELNVKSVKYDSQQTEEVVLDEHLTQELTWEGWVRELVRQIQDMRKEAGYHFSEKVFSQWHTEDTELRNAITRWEEFIKKNALLKEFSLAPAEGSKVFDIQKEFELAPQKKIWLGVKK